MKLTTLIEAGREEFETVKGYMLTEKESAFLTAFATKVYNAAIDAVEEKLGNMMLEEIRAHRKNTWLSNGAVKGLDEARTALSALKEKEV